MKKRIAPGTVVELDGRRGVTVTDLVGPMACCSSDETPVIWEGETSFEGTETDRLKEIGPEDPAAEPGPCGAGLGADCCIFLTVGAGGFCCERHTEARWGLVFKQMVAQRNPPEPYPACKKFASRRGTQ